MQKSNNLLEKLTIMKSLAKNHRCFHIAENLQELENKLTANQFNLVVMGQFKRGKSTLINALLRKEILPSGIIPVTSIITVIEYGSRLSIEVIFTSGESKAISRSEIPDFITELKNPSNLKSVALLKIKYPAPFLEHNLRIIDTPGVGSTYKASTLTTYAFIPKVDACVFLLSPDPPITESECAFIKDIQKQVAYFFFVLNKVDIISKTEDKENLLAFIKKVLLESLGEWDGQNIFCVSSLEALKAEITGDISALKNSGIQDLEAAITRFIIEKKEMVLESSIKKKASLLLDELDFSLSIEKSALLTPFNELQEKMNKLDLNIEHFREEQDNIKSLLTRDLAKVYSLLDEKLLNFKKEEKNRLCNFIKTFAPKPPPMGVKRLFNWMENLVAQKMIEDLEVLITELKEIIAYSVGGLLQKYANKINLILSEMRESIATLFNIKIGTLSPQEAQIPDFSIDYKIKDETSLIPLDMTTFLFFIPGFLLRHFISRVLQEKFPLYLEMNVGKVRYEIIKNIEPFCQNFINQQLKCLESEIAEIKELLSCKFKEHLLKENEIKNLIEALDAEKQELFLMRKSLQ